MKNSCANFNSDDGACFLAWDKAQENATFIAYGEGVAQGQFSIDVLVLYDCLNSGSVTNPSMMAAYNAAADVYKGSVNLRPVKKETPLFLPAPDVVSVPLLGQDQVSPIKKRLMFWK